MTVPMACAFHSGPSYCPVRYEHVKKCAGDLGAAAITATAISALLRWHCSIVFEARCPRMVQERAELP